MKNKNGNRKYYPNQIQVRLTGFADQNTVKVNILERNLTEGTIYSVCCKAVLKELNDQGTTCKQIFLQVPSGILTIEFYEDRRVRIHGPQKEQTSIVAAKEVMDRLTKAEAVRIAS